MYLINKKSHAHILEILAGFFDGFLEFPEFLNVHDDDTAFVAQRLHKGVLVGSLYEHGLVDVHVEHHRVELVAQLQTIDNEQNLVIDPFAFITQIFELQSCPTYYVALTESCSILQQERIDIFVVAITVSLGHYAVYQVLWRIECLQFGPQSVDKIQGFIFVVQKFLNTLHDPVAAEFLLRTRTYQTTCFVLILLFLYFMAIHNRRYGLMGVCHEVVVEYLLLDHLLGVERTHCLFEANARIGCFHLLYGEGLEYLLHHRTERRNRDGVVLKTSLCFIKELSRIPQYICVRDVCGYEVNRFLKRSEHTTTKRLRYIIATGNLGIFPYGFEVIGNDFVPAVRFCGLIGEVALQLGITEKNSVDKERQVGTKCKYLFGVVVERIAHLLDGRKYVFVEVLVSAQLRTTDINKLQNFAFECNGSVFIQEDSHVGTRLNLLANHIHNGPKQFLLVAIVFTLFEQIIPGLARILFQELVQIGRNKQIGRNGIILYFTKTKTICTAAEEVHYIFTLQLKFGHNPI